MRLLSLSEASIQKRTSTAKFARSPCTDRPSSNNPGTLKIHPFPEVIAYSPTPIRLKSPYHESSQIQFEFCKSPAFFRVNTDMKNDEFETDLQDLPDFQEILPTFETNFRYIFER
mgnify:CR=1 FL=1